MKHSSAQVWDSRKLPCIRQYRDLHPQVQFFLWLLMNIFKETASRLKELFSGYSVYRNDRNQTRKRTGE